MAQVLIRNLDDELVDAYREAAKRNGRSLEAQLREALWVMQPMTPKRVRLSCGRRLIGFAR